MSLSFYDQLCSSTETERAALLSRPVIEQALQGQVTRTQYLAFLTQAYHHVCHTVPLLMACGSRLQKHQQHLMPALAEYIEEEQGHEQWILNDIAAAGGNSNTAAQSTPHLSTQSMVAFAYHQIDRGNPVGFFGMVYVLEGTSTTLATQAAAVLQRTLGLPQEAFTYLNSHGSLDLQHIEFFKNQVNTLNNPADQQAIVATAKAMFHLYGEVFKSIEDTYGQ
jgi:pyrroloquinoline quinone (PQQ) biosynthesis protein C